MLGELFLPTETPEAPKQGFFKNLFGGTSILDREELCKGLLMKILNPLPNDIFRLVQIESIFQTTK